MTLDPMLTVLAIGAVVVVASFWRAHTNPGSFNAFDLLMENGKVSKIAFAFMLVLAVTTWVMVDLQLKGKMTEAYFLAFGGMWVAPLVAKIVFNKNDMPGTTSMTSTTTVSETTKEIL